MTDFLNTSEGDSFWTDSGFSDEATHCDYCNARMSDDEGYQNHDEDIFICQNCRPMCYDCDISMAHSVALAYYGCIYCRDCLPKYAAINRYHEPFTLNFLGSPKDKRFYGVELEVEGADDADLKEAARAVRDVMGAHLGDVQRDGSLNDGFEIITQPMSLDVHRNLWATDPLFLLRQKGFKSHQTTTCGLHIHVSRNALTEHHIEKLSLFLNNTDFQILWRRNSCNYARKCSVDSYGTNRDDRKDERYNILNLTNEKTIELRAPKGTLIPSTLLATIEAFDAMIDYTKTLSRKSCEEAKEQDFYDYVLKKTNFKTLKQYIHQRSKGVITKGHFKTKKVELVNV